MAPREKGAGETSGAGATSKATTAENAPQATQSAGTRVVINIQGHVIGRSGIEELTGMINEAVKDRDVRLVATQVRQGSRVTR